MNHQVRIQVRTISLCHTAKGDPHGGHLRPELVSPVPPALRKGINRSQTRSVCFLMRWKGLLPYFADRSRRPPSVKFSLNFILLRRQGRNALP